VSVSKIDADSKEHRMIYNPLVSIVIPVYNGSKYLSQAIDSALNQTYRNVEIIVVNDGSNDCGASEKIALSYGDKIRYIGKKENGGVATALNLAIANMKGEWFAWLSHDDRYKPTKIQRQIELLNKLIKENNDIDLLKTAFYGAAETININGTVIKKKLYFIKEHKSQLNMILDNVKNYSIGGCSVLIPKAAFNDVGLFDDSKRTVQDGNFWFRMIFKGYNFYFLKERLVQNRAHKRQVGKTNIDLFRFEQIEQQKWLTEGLWKFKQYRQWKIFWKLGSYQTKRMLPDANKQSFKYAKQLMNPVIYYVLIPFTLTWYKSLGISRELIIKRIYRKLMVK